MVQINPLVSNKTPGIIFSEIVMMSSAFSGAHFLVEGDDDSQFWKPKLHRNQVNIVSCEGKKNLTDAVLLFNHQAHYLIGGVYDSDFDRHFGIVHSPAVLASTDRNDLETTFLSSPALDLVLHEYADATKVAAYSSTTGMSVVDALKNMGSEFGRLRYLNHVEHHGVNFDNLSPYRYVSLDSWDLDVVALRSGYAAQCGRTLLAIDSAIQNKCPPALEWDLCQGHDCVRILAQGLKRTLGNRQMSEQELARVLRIAFSDALLASTSMYSALKVIENAMEIPMLVI